MKNLIIFFLILILTCSITSADLLSSTVIVATTTSSNSTYTAQSSVSGGSSSHATAYVYCNHTYCGINQFCNRSGASVHCEDITTNKSNLNAIPIITFINNTNTTPATIEPRPIQYYQETLENITKTPPPKEGLWGAWIRIILIILIIIAIFAVIIQWNRRKAQKEKLNNNIKEAIDNGTNRFT